MGAAGVLQAFGGWGNCIACIWCSIVSHLQRQSQTQEKHHQQQHSRSQQREIANKASNLSATVPHNFIKDVLAGRWPHTHQVDNAADWDAHAQGLLRGLNHKARQPRVSREAEDADIEKKLFESSSEKGDKFVETRALLKKMASGKWLQHPHNEQCRGIAVANTPHTLLHTVPSLGLEPLAQAWRDRHVVVEKQTWPAPRANIARITVGRRHGYCTCMGTGKTKHKIFLRVQAIMKENCSDDPDFNSMLMIGRVLLHLQGVNVEAAASDSDIAPKNLFFHISFQTKRPWNGIGTDFEETTSAPISSMPWSPQQATAIVHRQFTIKAGEANHLPVQNLFQLLGSLDLTLAWHMHFWLLSGHGRYGHPTRPLQANTACTCKHCSRTTRLSMQALHLRTLFTMKATRTAMMRTRQKKSLTTSTSLIRSLMGG